MIALIYFTLVYFKVINNNFVYVIYIIKSNLSKTSLDSKNDLNNKREYFTSKKWLLKNKIQWQSLIDRMVALMQAYRAPETTSKNVDFLFSPYRSSIKEVKMRGSSTETLIFNLLIMLG